MLFLAGRYIDYWCPPVPEFDGPAGIAAIALLISVAAVIYDKSKK
jgi:hypothetical protein